MRVAKHTGEADWNAYFKELWKGEVNEKTLDDFVKSYKGKQWHKRSVIVAHHPHPYPRTGSDEEREAILSTYTEHEGSLGELFEHVMCGSVLEDEERFIEIVNAAIKAKEVSSYPQWKKDVKDTKARNKRKADAKGEAAEAEELAKELGVHDKLYGTGSSKDGEESGKRGKRGAAKGKGKNVNEDGVDEDALKALIQSRNAQKNTMGNLIERMEAKYAAQEAASSSKKGKKKGRKADDDEEENDTAATSARSKMKLRGSGPSENAPESEPTEEEFAALQEKLFAKNGKEEEVAPAKKARRGKRG